MSVKSLIKFEYDIEKLGRKNFSFGSALQGHDFSFGSALRDTKSKT